jgi:O-antigen ligase
MFQDHPVAGVGFGRFYDTKLPYLSDRSQSFELESLRDLHHHNTFLGLLVETGLVGLCGYVAVLLGWGRIGLSMATSSPSMSDLRPMGRFLLVALAVYLPSALFHDVSHIFQDQWLLFTIAGLAVAICEQSLSPATSDLSDPASHATHAPTVGLS